MKYLKLFEDVFNNDVNDDVRDILVCLEDDGFQTQVKIDQPKGFKCINRLYVGIMKDRFTYADVKDVVDHAVSYLDEENLVISEILISDDDEFVFRQGHQPSFGVYLQRYPGKNFKSHYGEISVPSLSYFEENPTLPIIKYLKLIFLARGRVVTRRHND